MIGARSGDLARDGFGDLGRRRLRRRKSQQRNVVLHVRAAGQLGTVYGPIGRGAVGQHQACSRRPGAHCVPPPIVPPDAGFAVDDDRLPERLAQRLRRSRARR